jgi:hypothetical protein
VARSAEEITLMDTDPGQLLPHIRVALDCMDRGWAPVPNPDRSKNPNYPGWQNTRCTADNVHELFDPARVNKRAKPGTPVNGARVNVGVLMGSPSGWLVDADLDVPEAVIAARYLLPETGSVFGRAGAPLSHYQFIAPGVATKRYDDPGANGGKSERLCELLSTGAQSIMPGSFHKDTGEPIEWHADNGAAEVDGAELMRALGRIASASLLARRWPGSGRHDAALAISGALRRAGWSLEEAVLFMQAVTAAAHDEEVGDRVRAVQDTYDSKKPTTGWPRLAEMLGEQIVGRLRDWLGVPRDPPLKSYGGLGASVEDPPRIELISARALWDMVHAPTRWAVPGILPEGVTLLGGKPKAGKSWFALALAVAIGTGGRVLGAIDVAGGPVLYLALEDNKRRLTKRLRILCGAVPPVEQIEFLTECPRLGSGGEAVLRGWLQKHPDARLVVIDTVQKFRPHGNTKETLYASDYGVGDYLIQLCKDHQVSILVLAHLRKLAGDDPIDELSGTLGLTGGVDGYMVLRRPAASDDATLYVAGRDIEEPGEYCIAWGRDQARWTLTEGDPRVSRLPDQQRRAYELLSEAPRNFKELTEALNPGHVVDDPANDSRRKACSELVHRLKNKGLIERRTYDGRWWPIPVHTPSSTSSASSASTPSTPSNGTSEGGGASNVLGTARSVLGPVLGTAERVSDGFITDKCESARTASTAIPKETFSAPLSAEATATAGHYEERVAMVQRDRPADLKMNARPPTLEAIRDAVRDTAAWAKEQGYEQRHVVEALEGHPEALKAFLALSFEARI